MKVLAIDPSMRSGKMAWTVLSTNLGGNDGRETKLVDWGLVKFRSLGRPAKKVRKSLAWTLRRIDWSVHALLEDPKVRKVLRRMDRDGEGAVVIEMPRIYSRGSAAAMAGRNSGAIEKLIMLVVSIRSVVAYRYGGLANSIVCVYPQTWKGQVPKSVTLQRMKRRYGRVINEMTHDAVDSVGIGTWYVEKHGR